MGSVAVLSMHTSPLVQPGTGDSGGMNVYVRELGGSLARAGVPVSVFVRRYAEDLPDVVQVEPGLEVVHVDAGPLGATKEDLVDHVEEFADAVGRRIAGSDVEVLHANYWLSAAAAHRIKHDQSIPMVATFHTLARVKSAIGDGDTPLREGIEAQTIGCCDAICASNPVEAQELVDLYGADAERIELVPPGVDHAFFSPGDQRGARKAVGLDDRPTLLFVGRIQPLKGLTVAVRTLEALRHSDARLVVLGGPSGPEGLAELARSAELLEDLGLADRVTMVDPQPHHALSTWYRSADVVLVPSRSESFGLVALEAAACGVPVVASAVGGLRNLVLDGVTGYLVEHRDPIEMAARVDDLLADRDRAHLMGVRAADNARNYSWAGTAGRLRRLYADLAKGALVECA
ncbi:MAG: glycosyltransferase [Microthrixaceae bacterium]